MAQGNVGQSSGHNYTTNDTTLKYRTTNSGNPLQHDSVDANFDILRKAVNGIVSDISGVAGKTVGTNVPVGAVFTDTTYTHPNHTGDVTSAGDGATTITAGAVTSTKIATGAVTSTQIATGAVTNTKIATGAVNTAQIADDAIDGDKIADNSITTNQLLTEGNNSISLTQVVGKTLIIHIGNYYDRNGTQQLASDTFNYNSSNDTYGLRNNSSVPFSDSTHPGGWLDYHYDTASAETIKPFATVVAGARYALHNFGMGCFVQFMIHGHVTFAGEYDMQSSTSYAIKDVKNWDSFAGVSFLGASPGTYSGTDSAYIGYHTVTGRVDTDCNARAGLPPGWWFRGPRCMWSGVNFVFQKTNAGDISPLITTGHSFHELRGLRMAGINQPAGNNYFYPFRFEDQCKVFMCSGSNAPMEIYVSRNSNIISCNGYSNATYSNNHNSNRLFIDAQVANPGIRLLGQWGNAELHYKNSLVQIKQGITPATNINSFGQAGGYCKMFTQIFTPNWYVPGNAQNQTDGSFYYMFNHANGTPSTNTSGFTYSGDPYNGLKSKWASPYTSALTALSPTRLTGNDSFKVRPTARQDDPYTDQQ